jgi:hypothetical protein
VIVNEIDIANIASFESKNDPPVGSHCDGPQTFRAALERVQVERLDIQILRALRCVERG